VVMLAYSYPILGVFWSMLIFFGFLVVIWVVIWCFVDDFRRSDHSGLAKAGWAVLIIFLPLIGSLIYIIARPPQV
jgi:Phospholipase_D-nuclease N-terminal